MAIQLNDDVDHVAEIKSALKENEGYCPCMVQKSPETKCMCHDFKNMEEGTCHCGLFVKTRD